MKLGEQTGRLLYFDLQVLLDENGRRSGMSAQYLMTRIP